MELITQRAPVSANNQSLQQVGKKAEAEEFEANAQSPNRSNGQKVFSWLGDAILSTPGVILVLLLAAGLLGGGVYGTTQLQQATNSWQSIVLSPFYSHIHAHEQCCSGV